MAPTLRLVITTRCNYKCFFCHNETVDTEIKELLTADDYTFLYIVSNQVFGTNTVTLTGGEPFLRSDLYEIVDTLHDQGAYIKIVTNGSVHVDTKKFKNVDRYNISIHSLNKSEYREITQSGNLSKVLDQVKTLCLYKENSVKINSVLCASKEIQTKRIIDIEDIAQQYGAKVEFIEEMADTPLLKIYDCIDDLLNVHDYTLVLDKNSDAREVCHTINPKLFESSYTDISCNFVKTSVDIPRDCKKKWDIFITPDGCIKPCKYDTATISILEEIKKRNSEKLCEKIKNIWNSMGRHCPQKINI